MNPRLREQRLADLGRREEQKARTVPQHPAGVVGAIRKDVPPRADSLWLSCTHAMPYSMLRYATT